MSCLRTREILGKKKKRMRKLLRVKYSILNFSLSSLLNILYIRKTTNCKSCNSDACIECNSGYNLI